MDRMILICDSGSTKADWALIQGKSIVSEFQTEGLNPVHLPEVSISEKLNSEKNISSNSGLVSKVYFFGAGCGSGEGKLRMTGVLQRIFPGSKVTVENDLMAAAISVCGNEEGIVAILGTGSNCCYYDGSKVHLKNFGLGYILGDEASGAWFGKKFLHEFLYQQLPATVEAAFISEFKLGRQEIIENVYRKPSANLFLSSFMPFIIRQKENEYMTGFLQSGLNEFFTTNVRAFQESKNTVVHFVGSVAAQLEKEIRDEGRKTNLKIGKIVKQPMEGLIKYYTG